jgi:hypothetical protein
LDYADEREEAPSDEANDGEYVDEEEAESAMGTLTVLGKTAIGARIHLPRAK